EDARRQPRAGAHRVAAGGRLRGERSRDDARPDRGRSGRPRVARRLRQGQALAHPRPLLPQLHASQRSRAALPQAPRIRAHVPPQAQGLMAGDLVYYWIPVPDPDRAKAFYGEVLGWEFEQGSHADGWQVTNTQPHSGISGASEASHPQVCFMVDDLEAAM